MPFTLPTSADQQTMSAKFADVYIEGQLVACATQLRAGMRHNGDWIQCIGEDTARNNPDTRWGSGTMDRLTINANALDDILAAAGDIPAGSFATGEADLRFLPLTFSVLYNDGRKKRTQTFHEAYIRTEETTWQGNRLIMDTVTFEYKLGMAANS